MFSRSAYHFPDLRRLLAGRLRALIDLTPKILKLSAAAIGEQGGASRVITHSNMRSKSTWRNTWLMPRCVTAFSGDLINSRSKTRSFVFIYLDLVSNVENLSRNVRYVLAQLACVGELSLTLT